MTTTTARAMSLALGEVPQGESAPRSSRPKRRPGPRRFAELAASSPRNERIALLKALLEDPARIAAAEVAETDELVASSPTGLIPALDLLAAIRKDRLGDDSYIVAFVHGGPPHSKARPRWSPKSGRTYTPAETARAERSLSKRFERALQGRQLEGNVAIAAVFYRPNHQRIDADNLMKLVLDAATKAGVWLDDSQVTAQACLVEVDADAPRTLIALGPTASTMNRTGQMTATCRKCGTAFVLARTKTPTRIYCSKTCAKPTLTARCARCGTDFTRRRAAQRYCSTTCAARDPIRRQADALLRPAPTCTVCGGRVSRREYQKCAKCRRTGRPLGSKNKPTLGLVADR